MKQILSDDEYIVSALLTWRTEKKNHKPFFYVSWEGYTEADNTWEPYANVSNLEIMPLFLQKNNLKVEKGYLYHADSNEKASRVKNIPNSSTYLQEAVYTADIDLYSSSSEDSEDELSSPNSKTKKESDYPHKKRKINTDVKSESTDVEDNQKQSKRNVKPESENNDGDKKKKTKKQPEKTNKKDTSVIVKKESISKKDKKDTERKEEVEKSVRNVENTKKTKTKQKNDLKGKNEEKRKKSQLDESEDDDEDGQLDTNRNEKKVSKKRKSRYSLEDNDSDCSSSEIDEKKSTVVNRSRRILDDDDDGDGDGDTHTSSSSPVIHNYEQRDIDHFIYDSIKSTDLAYFNSKYNSPSRRLVLPHLLNTFISEKYEIIPNLSLSLFLQHIQNQLNPSLNLPFVTVGPYTMIYGGEEIQLIRMFRDIQNSTPKSLLFARNMITYIKNDRIRQKLKNHSSPQPLPSFQQLSDISFSSSDKSTVFTEMVNILKKNNVYHVVDSNLQFIGIWPNPYPSISDEEYYSLFLQSRETVVETVLMFFQACRAAGSGLVDK